MITPATALDVSGTISATQVMAGTGNLTPSGTHAFIVSPSMIVGSNIFIHQPIGSGPYPGGNGMRFHYSSASQLGVIDTSGTGGLWIRSKGDLSTTMAFTNDNKVGIGGLTAPSVALEVTGSIVAQGRDTGSATSINFGNGNTQWTSAACGAFTLSGMVSGGIYTLITTGSGTGPATFTHSGFTVKKPGTLTCTTAKVTLFSFAATSNTIFVSMVTGY